MRGERGVRGRGKERCERGKEKIKELHKKRIRFGRGDASEEQVQANGEDERG